MISSLFWLLQLYTISRNGRLNVWDCNTKLDGLIKKIKGEDDDANLDGEDDVEEKEEKKDEADEQSDTENEEGKKKNRVAYRKVAK